MAYGQWADYQPSNIAGATAFKTVGGQTMLFSGPQAEDLKKRIDASKSMGPQPTAMAPTPAPTGTENPVAGMSVPNDNVSRPDVSAPTPGVEAAPAEAPAPAGPAKPARQITSQEHDEKGRLRKTFYNDGTVEVVTPGTPGSPGITKAQLETAAENSVAMPSSTVETKEGGFAYNADYTDQLEDANFDKVMALHSLADSQAAAAEAERGLAAQQAAQAAETANDERKRQTEIEGRVSKDQAALDKAKDDYNSATVDPTRMFSGVGGAARGIGFAIAAGMGAWAATGRGGQNYALNQINRFMDDDIATQQAEVRIKGEKANNALQQLTRSTGSLEQAKSALKITQLEYAKQKAAEVGAKYKGQQAQAANQMTLAGLDEALAKEMEAYRQASLGRHTEQVSKAFARPRAPTAGTPTTVNRFVQSEGDKKNSLANDKLYAEANKAGKPVVSAAGQKAQSEANVIDQIGKRLEGKNPDEAVFAPENQNIVTRGVRGATNLALGDRTWLAGNEKERAGASEFDLIKNDLMAQTSVLNGQGAMSDPEAKRATTAIGEARTWGDLQRMQKYMSEKSGARSKAYSAPSAAPEPTSAEDLGGEAH